MVHSVKIFLVFVVGLMLYGCANNPKPARVNSKELKTTKLSGDDQSPRVFQKRLTMQNLNFDICAIGEGSIQQIIIQPIGLTIDTTKIRLDVAGNVTGAEIADLNSDGFPEVLIYTASAGSGSYGDVIAYSVNKGISISRIKFPILADNVEAGRGYKI